MKKKTNDLSKAKGQRANNPDNWGVCSLTVNDDVDVFVLSSLSKTKFLNRAPASLSIEHTSTKSRSQLGVFVFCVCVYDCDSP